MNLFRKHVLRTTYINGVYQIKRNVWNVIFFGTDHFSRKTLDALNISRHSHGTDKLIDRLDVVCVEGNCPVKKYCTENGLKFHIWPFIVPKNQYDIGVVVSFGHLVHAESILNCKYGMINGHPSLLPRWRGAAPIQHTVLHGDHETGVTVLEVSPKKFDVGKILMQKRLPVPPNCSSQELSDILSHEVAETVLETLKRLPQYLENAYPQPESGVTLATKLKPGMGAIDWHQSTSEIVRKFRAFTGYIKLYTYWKESKILLHDLLDLEEASTVLVETLVKKNVAPGYLFYHKKRKVLFVKCKDGWIGFHSLSVPKRGKITASDFYNGFITKVDEDDAHFDFKLNLNTKADC